MAIVGKSDSAASRDVPASTMQQFGPDCQSLGCLVAAVVLMLSPISPTRAQSTSPIDSVTLRRVLAAEGIDARSLVGIRETGHNILVDTHINPSAGTIVVLNREKKRVRTLPGWVLRVLPGDVVLYHRNSVHFAPIHWVELWTWDPVTGRNARLYPNAPYDSVRRAYIDTVAAIYRRVGKAWFTANNHHMDPTKLDTRLSDSIVVAPKGGTLSFTIVFGSGDGTPAATPEMNVAVVCQDVATKRARCVERVAP